MCKNTDTPSSIRFDQATLEAIASIVSVSPTPRDRTSAIRGIVRKYKRLMASQVSAEEEGLSLAIVQVAGPAGGSLEVVGQLTIVDLKL